MNTRQINRIETRNAQATGRRGHQGKLCSCCCKGTVQDEVRAIRRGNRRLGRLLVAAELSSYRNEN